MEIAIIGGGNMGRWLARFLKNEGESAVVIETSADKLAALKKEGIKTSSDIKSVKDAGIIFLAVQIDSFEAVLKDLSLITNENHIILDIASIKEKPVKLMQKYIKKGQILGTHPVFGPGAKSLQNQHYVLTPTNPTERELALQVEKYLAKRGAIVSLMSPKEHDKMMAVILGLAHYIAIVSADTLAKMNSLKEMEGVSGITYKVLMTLVESVLSEDPDLYASLQMNLPHLHALQNEFIKRSTHWAEMVQGGEKEQFTKEMNALKKRLEQDNPDFGKAYDNMYRIADSLK